LGKERSKEIQGQMVTIWSIDNELFLAMVALTPFPQLTGTRGSLNSIIGLL
jgi:hypothetical protein